MVSEYLSKVCEMKSWSCDESLCGLGAWLCLACLDATRDVRRVVSISKDYSLGTRYDSYEDGTTAEETSRKPARRRRQWEEQIRVILLHGGMDE